MAHPIDNKNVIQTYIFTVARYDFSLGEKRIMYRLVELAQSELQGIMIRDNMYKIEPYIRGRVITMPIAAILNGEEDKNHAYAKKTFKSLAGKFIEYEDNKVWIYTGIINQPEFDRAKGTVTFNVADKVWEAMLDFSKGYRKYELLTAMRFKSVYAMRMYELISGGQKSGKPMQHGLEELKQMFGVADKYKLAGHFKAKVLDVAKEELDKSSPWSFKYIDVKEGRKIVGFKFFAIYLPDNQDAGIAKIERQSKLTARNQISGDIYDLLRYTLGFDVKAINKNKATIVEGEETIPGFYSFLQSLAAKSAAAANPIGYIINAIKNKTAELRKKKPDAQGLTKDELMALLQAQAEERAKSPSEDPHAEPEKDAERTPQQILQAIAKQFKV